MEWSIDNYLVTLKGTCTEKFSDNLMSELEGLLKESRDQNIQLKVDVSKITRANSGFYGSWILVLESYYDKDVAFMKQEKPITFILEKEGKGYQNLKRLHLDEFFQYEFI